MQVYTPTKYEAEALTWAIRNAPTLAEKVRSGEDYFYELRGEAGPNLDEFALLALAKANAFLKSDYVAVNVAWAKQFRSDNS
jgi:hypothetical protein